ncbi:MAG TPA: FAD-linked oxidase C-terminal domain-containing protein [Casimicrobiaceae bacterium]|nr:FAD-linked oxidase C-terminal domain-containing protein [Casimicrobiaceae bacterium]
MPALVEPGKAPVSDLVERLRESVRGEIGFDAGTRALYATDASNYRQVPIGVVVPRTIDEVVATVAECRRHGLPVLPRGGGTSLAGQCCNVAVVIDCSKYLNRIVELDAVAHRARVEPGVVLDDLRDAAEVHHLTFAPDPSTHTHNTLGGMIGNNSCGVHSVMGGKTVDNVLELDVLTYDALRLTVGPTSDAELQRIVMQGGRRGAIYRDLKQLADRYADEIRARYPKIPRRVSGYNLDQLLPENGFDVARALVGSEGTCVSVLGATLRLVASPPARSLLVLGYPDVFAAADDVPTVLKHGPIGLEGIDDRLIDDMKAIGLHPDDVRLLPPGGGWLMAEFGGATREESDARARACMDALRATAQPPSMKLFDDRREERMLWTVRESGLGATAHVPGKPVTWEGWEDAAVAPDKLGDYLRAFRALLDRHGYRGDLYGHFGDGCVHTRIDFDLETRAGIDRFHAFLEDASDLVVRFGGSFSGEHGDGQSKAQFLPKLFGPAIVQAFREFKAIWDPTGRMNPGKIVDPYAPTENLRLGTTFDPIVVQTHFRYPGDAGRFNRALLRCVGIGNCRQQRGDTMCPSYRVTREERHSTRGRARLLFEMARGDVLKQGLREPAVKEALDLCLSCKGCKGDCPVHVDMATYRAEFLAHYYARRLRPLRAYAFGFIGRWARIGTSAPRLFNAMLRAPLLRSATRAALHVAQQRDLPAVARESFASRFANRSTASASGERVLLWPDTFTNFFQPQIGAAAVRVLEASGYRPSLPRGRLCCGRTLYEFGFLDAAKRYLRRIIEQLGPEIDAGVPLIVLEPACAAVFRDELVNLFPDDERARRLAAQTYFFDEFLERRGVELPLRPPARAVLVHTHCNRKALCGKQAGGWLLSALAVDGEVLDSGCCGMAGAFGFERDKYEVSRAIAENALMPRVRAAATDTLLIADGFSCREQILHCTGRQALHPAEVLAMALADSTVARSSA